MYLFRYEPNLNDDIRGYIQQLTAILISAELLYGVDQKTIRVIREIQFFDKVLTFRSIFYKFNEVNTANMLNTTNMINITDAVGETPAMLIAPKAAKFESKLCKVMWENWPLARKYLISEAEEFYPGGIKITWDKVRFETYYKIYHSVPVLIVIGELLCVGARYLKLGRNYAST